MPAIKETVTVEKTVGMVCDCCGKRDEDGCNDFHVAHTFGYGTPLDMTQVTAAICDECLARILLACVPGAVFSNFHDCGGVQSHAEIRAVLDRRVGRPVPAPSANPLVLRAKEARAAFLKMLEETGGTETNPGLMPEMVAEIERLEAERDEWKALAVEARNRLCASHVPERLKDGLIKRIDAKASA
jgi:hypothetical protein